MRKLSILVVVASVSMIAAAQSKIDTQNTDRPRMASQNASQTMPTRQIAQGVKTKLRGVIVQRQDSSYVVRDEFGSDVTVSVTASTKVEEKKGNPFRGSKKYTQATLTRGLNVEIEGRGDSSGALAAEKIKFSDIDLRYARAMETQIVPVEHRVGDAEDRLTRSEQNAERLSGQVQELTEVSNLARGGALAAQESADAAIDGVNKTNDRISSLDEYEVRKTATINFRVGSSVLSPDAKIQLDEIATQAKSEKGFVIEVRGFASADGSENLNRQLSTKRSDAVVRYLAENHDIPLRRIVLPYGYGEAMPVADNTTREGRKENRRAEVRILISRGMTTPVNVNRSVSSNTNNQGSRQE